LAGIKALQVKTLVTAAKSFAPPPESVSSVVVRQERWESTINAIGSVMAV